MTIPTPLKAVVGALFFAVSFYAFFVPSGPLNTAAWAALVPLDAIVVGYYVLRKRRIAR